jgi:PAS domain S-box-containing protein
VSQPPAPDDRYRVISELTSDYAFAFRVEADGSAQADWLNDAFTRVTGFTVDDLRAHGWLAMVHPEDRLAARRHARRLLAGAPDASEHRIVTTTGEVRWLHSSARPVRDPATGRITRIYGAAHDITERKRADAERAALLARERQARSDAETAQRRFAFLAEASSLLSSSLDFDTTLANLAELAVTSLADWCAIYLVEPDGVRLKTVAPADPAHREWARHLPARYPVPSAGVLRVLGTGRSELLMEIDPERISALATDPQHQAVLRALRSSLCVPLVARGRTLGALVFASAESTRRYDAVDVTLAEDLARRAAQAVDNARLYREAQEADRRKDRFLALLGHELRNPLAAISAAGEVLKRLQSADGPGTQPQAIIERQTQNLARLVDELLDVSRIASGKITLARRTVDVNEVVRRSAEALGMPAGAGAPELLVDVGEQPVLVDGDPIRLEQVVTNLLDNARKYTPARGRVRITVAAERGEARIHVADTGIGISPEVISRIFEPFAQGASPLQPGPGGLGLGLTLVRGLVERHGGRVTARSAGPALGSEFVVHLPLAAPGAPAPAAASPAAPPPAAPRRILLVEDNADGREALRSLLELLGHHVQVAEDGHRGVELAFTARPDVGLVDIGLPGIDGYEVARRLRADPSGRDMLLVALTGYGQPEDERRALEAGFDAHLVKPVDPDVLEDLLAGRRSPREAER